MGVRPGYKQTEVGLIPDDWEVVQIGSLGNFAKGQGIKKNEADSGDIPCIRYGEIYTFHDDILRSFNSRISAEVATTSKRIKKGDLLFTGSGETKEEIGKCVAYLGEGVAYAGGDIVILSPFNEDSEFLGYLLNTPLIARQKASKGQGDAVVHISANALSSINIPLPPTKAEQTAIAEALGDGDALLAGLGRLIAKKRNLKQAALHQLLTAKTRLPGFGGEWQVKRLGDVGDFLKGSGVRKDEAQSGGIPCIRYGEIYTRHSDYIKRFHSFISREVAATATPIKHGDLLFAGSGETKEEIGKCVSFVDTLEAYAGGDIVILRPSGVDPLFMGYYCNTATINAQKSGKGQGDAVVHISATALSSIEVAIPTIEEQTAIATVLSDMDAEITALERRLAKTRDLKQAMMQELLTGRTRLVGPRLVSSQDKPAAKPTRSHSKAFNEAVVISVLVKHFGSAQFPLGRKRYTKLSYLLHRHAEGQAEGYMKKAAGPYNPQTRYGGAEKIAIQNGYVREHKAGKYNGFVAADEIATAEAYFEKWYGAQALQWLEQFRYKKNDELELLATVDMAVEDLRHSGQPVSVENVKAVIRAHPEWQAKLDRAIFADNNIAGAINESQGIFNTDNTGGNHA